jgi:hypothetical protein
MKRVAQTYESSSGVPCARLGCISIVVESVRGWIIPKPLCSERTFRKCCETGNVTGDGRPHRLITSEQWWQRMGAMPRVELSALSAQQKHERLQLLEEGKPVCDKHIGTGCRQLIRPTYRTVRIRAPRRVPY